MNSCCEMPLQAAHNIANDKDIRPQTCCKMPMQAAPEISAGQRHSDIEQRHSTTEKKQSARDQRHSTTEQRHSATNASTEINFIHEDCCEFQTLEISTDEFTRDAEQQTTQNLTQLNHVWTVIIALLQKITPDNTITLTQLFTACRPEQAHLPTCSPLSAFTVFDWINCSNKTSTGFPAA